MMSGARVWHRIARFTLAAAMAGGIAACGSSSSEPKVVKDITPASMVPTSTDTLRGVVGGAVSAPLTVVVKNKAGEPIDSAIVAFAVASGGGSISATNVRTTAGQASTNWTFGPTSGVQTVTATAGGLSVTFVGIATASPAAAIAKVSGDAQTALVGATVPIAPSVKVTDKFGNPVQNALVTFSVTGGGGSVSGAAVNSGPDGLATVGSWKLGTTVGANTMTAGTGAFSVTFTATATVGPAATVTISPASAGELNAGQTSQLTVRAVDAGGNVIPTPVVAWTTSSATVASVSSTGLVTAVGAGNATITATVGTASASVPVSVIGHPASFGIAASVSTGTAAPPSDVAFTKSAMLVAVSGLQQVFVFDPVAATQTGVITLSTADQLLSAPPRAEKPAVAVNIGTASRLWFLDPTTATIIDSTDVSDVITGVAGTSDGSKFYAMLADGELAVVDGALHNVVTRISLGGGVTKIRVAPGDTLLYAFTTVGVIFAVDLKANVVKQQIIATIPASTDIAISRSGRFYLLDASANLVRIYDLASQTVTRSVGVAPFATTIAVSPDEQQIWLTHAAPYQATVYVGNPNNGYISAAEIPLSASPIRVYFNPTGSLAAIPSLGGRIDIIR